MSSGFQVVTQPFVNLTIISTNNEYGVEKRYPKDVLVADLKNKLEMITGLIGTDMKLKILNKEKKLVCDLNDDNKMIGFYPVEDGYYLEVEASQSLVSKTEDPNFKRFELTEEEYAKKKNTVREFKEKNKLGQFSPNAGWMAQKKEEELKERLEKEKQLIENIKTGSRCQVNTLGQMSRLGTVMFVGEMENKVGYWVGVKYDEPLGKNDGSADGKRYFECLPKYGGFTKPENVVTGDFPEETFDDEL
jgi:tubulin-folding cofactor B